MPPTKKKKKTTGRAKRRPGEPHEVATRSISKSTMAVLWGRAAGRCEFRGCNLPLWKSPVTQEPVNIAQMAHIYSFSPAGPRGNAGVRAADLNRPDNLLLVCHPCHRKIDAQPDGGRYSVEVLRQMKQEHEQRVEMVTGISVNRRSHVLLYGINIGDQEAPLSLPDAANAMFPDYYPAADQPIQLGGSTRSNTDRTATFWESERQQLCTLFERRVRVRISSDDIDHLSVFALAPQPLLILLGSLLGDITPSVVYGRHRDPQAWTWPRGDFPPLNLKVEFPPSTSGRPALVLALSGTVSSDRITSVLDNGASIWRVTVSTPQNTLLKSPRHITEFRTALRPLLDQIKAGHGQSTPVHVFPAVPAALAVELGRLRIPKADAPWEIYDQNNALGGFVHALTIPGKES